VVEAARKIGVRRSGALPGDGQAAIREASWRTVEAGGGWIGFMARRPVTRLPVDEMNYIAPALRGQWAMRCSINTGMG
jgi:hypothetical protein